VLSSSGPLCTCTPWVCFPWRPTSPRIAPTTSRSAQEGSAGLPFSKHHPGRCTASQLLDRLPHRYRGTSPDRGALSSSEYDSRSSASLRIEIRVGAYTAEVASDRVHAHCLFKSNPVARLGSRLTAAAMRAGRSASARIRASRSARHRTSDARAVSACTSASSSPNRRSSQELRLRVKNCSAEPASRARSLIVARWMGRGGRPSSRRRRSRARLSYCSRLCFSLPREWTCAHSVEGCVARGARLGTAVPSRARQDPGVAVRCGRGWRPAVFRGCGGSSSVCAPRTRSGFFALQARCR
jgi:hypothetical protein